VTAKGGMKALLTLGNRAQDLLRGEVEVMLPVEPVEDINDSKQVKKSVFPKKQEDSNQTSFTEDAKQEEIMSSDEETHNKVPLDPLGANTSDNTNTSAVDTSLDNEPTTKTDNKGNL